MPSASLSATLFKNVRLFTTNIYVLTSLSEASRSLDVIVPVDLEGKKVKSKMYVIKDPKLESKDWIVCLEGQIHRKDTIGTILDEINLYVKDTYKLKSPTRINYNDTDAEDITEPPEDVAEEAVIVSELREEIENSISNE